VTTIAGDAKTITGIVKELDQPVNSILGYTDLLLGESTGILNPMQRKYLERIRIAMERMGGLIDDLLQAFSFSQDEFKFSPREVNLVPLITAAVQDAKDYLQEKEIRLQIDIPEELPTIFADETSLRRAVTSLLRKAGDSSRRSGDVRLKARVEAEENETSFVMLQVFDSSDGIPVQELPRVFSRVYSPSKAETGQRSKNGMDLATVKAVIEAHGGRIWVDSTLGEGSTYSALLPIPGR
jgi:signal transduction histidine kinase